MSIKIGNYTITKDDERNLKLTHTRKKGLVKGVDTGEDTEYFIGYFGYLDQALSKIINTEGLEAVKGKEELSSCLELYDKLVSVYDMIKRDYHISVKSIDKD